MFLISLAIGRQRLQIGADDRDHAAALGLPGNLARRGLALTQCFLEAFDRDRQANLAAMPEPIRDGLGDTEDLHWHTFDLVRLDAFRQQGLS